MVKVCHGALRHRIAIEADSVTSDGGGGLDKPWATPTTVAKVWAAIQPLRGAERLKAQQLEESITHKITIRYRTGISPSQRVNFKGRIFNIRSVINVEERNRWLELLCEEGVAT